MKISITSAVFLSLSVLLCPIVLGQDDTVTDPKAALLAAVQDPEADFYEALKQAEEAGLDEATIVEARFMKMLRSGDWDGVLAFIPKLEEQLEHFDVGMGKGFISREQAEGFVDTLKAIRAYRGGDWESFDGYYVNAFRKAPMFAQNVGLAQILSEHQNELVMESAAKNIVVPMDMKIANAEGETKTLSEWMGDDKALLVDFWASWCGPCIRLMPELKHKAAALSSQGIYVAAMNTDNDDQLNKAVQVREQHAMESVNWLIDPNGSELSGMLFINSIPRMVLIDPNGNVLFNGHPMDETLNDALASVGAILTEEG